jgi:hypothetical protein
MKKNQLTIAFLILLFSPIHLFAQDITGLWKGSLYDDTVKQYIPYEIAVSEEKGKLTGYSYAVFKGPKGDEVGLKTIKIKKIGGNRIEIEDIDMIANSYSISPSKKVKKLIELSLAIKDSIMTMRGSWSTNWTKQYHPVTGTIELERKNDYWHEPLIKRLDSMKLSGNLSFVEPAKMKEAAVNNASQKDTSFANVENQQPIVNKNSKKGKPQEVIVVSEKNPAPVEPDVTKPIVTPPAAEVAQRKISTIQSIFFQSDSLLLTLYDNGEIDGDTVSIVMGNQLIFAKAGISDKPITKTIYTKEIPDSEMLILYAENLGSIPPNTGLLIIYDGKDRYEIFFSADLQTNAAVMLRRKKNEL